MFYRIRYKYTLLALSTAMLLIMSASCGNSGQPNAQQQSAQQQQTQEEEPEKLKNIESRLEALIETLGGPAVVMEQKKEGQEEQGTRQQETQSQDGQQGTRQGGGQETQQGTQQGTQEQQGTRQQGGQQENPQSKDGQKQNAQDKESGKWSQVGTLISNLHYQWNEFMPEIAKKGADMKLVDNFDNALNNLTTTALAKDGEKTLSAANRLYSFIPDIYSLFRVKMSPEIKRMIYHTRSIVLEAAKDNWEQVKKDNEALEKSWSLFRNTLEKEQQKTGDMLDFSIYELGKVSEGKDRHLADIKGRIVLSNIQALQKSFEEKK